MKKNRQDKINRRKFISTAVTAVAGFTILPSHTISGLGYIPPSDKLNIAGVGIGGVGRTNIRNSSTENIVALCDVDWKYSEKTFDDYPKAKKYHDWRRMFDEMNDSIDAVIIATSDHTHAIIAAHAITLGKHVYVQKPLTHSVYESRLLTNLARKYKVATQMGNQGNSGEGIRQVTEWIQSGAIGKVHKAYAWTNRPIWPQGLERPTDIYPIPETLSWNLFLGPAPERPYNPIYTPWNWRGWWDYGTGALGDMACHIMDPVFKALNLRYPVKVQASSTQINTESPPHAEIVHYTFPARDNMPEVEVSWYDGGLLPERPEDLPDGEILGRDKNGGCIFEGSEGKLMCGAYGRDPILLPYDAMESFSEPAKTIRRPETEIGKTCWEGTHEQDWIRACKESPENRMQSSSNFDYAGPLNEMVVMGVVAVRLQDLNRVLLWDGKNMRFTNISDTDEIRVVTSDSFEVIDGHPHFDTQRTTINAKQAAEEYIKHQYRYGWSLPEMP
ncbi:MAG: Gfo/Idh/MocA family oxidoreductase [Bacteroidales bacterium]|nr:Gfo/Idh/MocA family oxidoreductase [Bacteroidales bacterium]